MNLNINYRSILGFTLPHLPYFPSALKKAFPGFELVNAQNENDVYKLHFQLPGGDESLFAVSEATSLKDDQYIACGYCCWLKVMSPDILLFDEYRINQTRLIDISNFSFNRVDFDPRETCLECHFELGRGINGVFYFVPPPDYSGSLKSMNKEQIGNCQLSDFVLFLSPKDQRPKAFISEKEGLDLYEKMLKQYSGKPITTKEEQTAGPKVAPIDEILRKSFNFRNGISAYLRLANLATHTGVKTKVKQALSQALEGCGTDYPGPEELFEAVLNARPNEKLGAWPLFSIDWKGTIKDDLDFAVRSQLGKIADNIKLPNADALANNNGLLENDRLTDYAKQIEACGFDLYWGGLAQNDSLEFLLAPVKNRNKMKLFIRDSRCEMNLVTAKG